MNREIKFRAWDTKRKMMCEPQEMMELLEEGFHEYIVMQPGENWGYEYAEFMQFIGLKDRKGREIYEGDILGGIVGWYVTWIPEETRFGFDFDGEKRELFFDELKQKDLEVIGNIYENPELLTPTSKGGK